MNSNIDKSKLRIDELIVKKGLAPTKSQAKSLILQGLVSYNDKKVEKAGQIVNLLGKLEVKETNQYVGRGANKLQAAIQNFNIDVKNKIVADIGASTGGFTDYLLQNGARKIYAIDVGTGQLAEKLRTNPKVINLENTNIKDVVSLPEDIDFAVVDLSYISLRKVLSNIFKLTSEIIVLFKPQFECGPGVVNRQGIILDEKILKQTLEEFENWCEEQEYEVKNKMESPITGKVGNREYLLYLTCK